MYDVALRNVVVPFRPARKLKKGLFSRRPLSDRSAEK
jgi:hypothetical protein